MGRARRGFVFAALACASTALAHCSDDGQAPDDGIGLPERGVRDADTEAVLEAAAPPPPPCDTTKPFGAPALVLGIDGEIFAATPRLSQDELTIYFTSYTTGDAGVHTDLFRAERTKRDAPFTNVAVMAQSSPANDNDPAVSADHLTLWFHSARSGNADLYFATRTATSSDFGAPKVAAGLSTPDPEAHAYPRASEVWFTSVRDGGAGGYDIYVAARQDGGFGPPAAVASLVSDANDWQPAPTEDGRWVVFASDRDGGAGGFDLYLANRASGEGDFSAPRALTELNSPTNDFSGWISPDACRVYFSSDRAPPGDPDASVHHRIWTASRPR